MPITTLDGTPVTILGLGNHPQMDSNCVPIAWEAGINYFFFYNLTDTNLLDELKSLLSRHREKLVVTTGTSARSLTGLRKYLEQVRCQLDTEVVDIFFAEYISPSDHLEQVQTVIAELQRWKEAGWIRYVGATTHNRSVAVELMESQLGEILMHRYNMAHRKAEAQVLPLARQKEIPVVAFTCTRWGSLLKGHPDWHRKTPTAAECYRFALKHPAIHLALTAPPTPAELEENLEVLQASPMTGEEIEHWQEYGDLIYGNGRDDFETQWL